MFVFSGVLETLFSGLVDLLRERPARRPLMMIIASLVAAISVAALAAQQRLYPEVPPVVQIAVGLIGLAGFAVLLATVFSYTSVTVPTLTNELEPIHAERLEIEEKLRGEDETDVYSSLELNLNHLSEYYTINKSQARASFRMGVLSVLLGLCAILVGVGLLYRSGDGNLTVATLSAVAGLLAQFIGGSCFYLYKKSQDQTNRFYDGLTSIQGRMLAIRLCDQIQDSDLRDVTRQSLIRQLAGIKQGRENRKNAVH